MRVLQILSLVCFAYGLEIDDPLNILSKRELSKDDIAAILANNNLVPDGTAPMEYASFLINGDKWSDYVVKEAGEFKHLSGDDVRANIAELLEAAKLSADAMQGNFARDATTDAAAADAVTTAAQADEVTTAAPAADEVTTAAVVEEVTTVTEAPTTTLDPADFEKSGSPELLMENIVYSGHMMHWSPSQSALYIADIWALRVLRFEEIPPPTTTVPPSPVTEAVTDAVTEAVTDAVTEAVTDADAVVTTESELGRQLDVTDAAVTESAGAAQGENTFDIRSKMITKEVIHYINPDGIKDYEHAVVMPTNDLDNAYNGKNMVLSAGGRLVLTSIDMEVEASNITQEMDFDSYHNSDKAGAILLPYQVLSPAWVDPAGKMFVGTYDLRPLLHPVANSRFCMLRQTMECEYEPLQALKLCHPSGASFSSDNSTLYVLDAVSRSIYYHPYELRTGEAGESTNEVNLAELAGLPDARPYGMATDENSHLWIGLNTETESKIIEFNPETEAIISTIEFPEAGIVDLGFAGENFEFMYILTKKNLYKMEDLGVDGLRVPDFEMVRWS